MVRVRAVLWEVDEFLKEVAQRFYPRPHRYHRRLDMQLESLLDECFDLRRQLKPCGVLVPFWFDDDSSDQPAVDILADFLVVVVERPRADHLVRNVVGIRPTLAGANLVGAANGSAVNSLRTEGPRAVGIDPVRKAVQVETVRIRVAVQDMD